MKVREAMSTRVVTVTPDTPLADAMRTMLRERISGLPVVDAQGALAGVLTEGDLMRRAETGTEPTHPAWLRFLLGPGRMAREFTASHARHVGEVMTREVVAIGADAPLADAVRLMEQHRVKRLPVLGERGLEGILSRADLLRAFVATAADAAPDDLSDAAIARRIVSELDAKPWTPRETMSVDVHDGVVTLRGVLVDDSVRAALVVLAENTAGVVRVEDQLTTVEPMMGMVVRAPEP
ncbi:CBS domain-containing protein [Rhodanobacter aciditrophus]|uniref:CBS domain-containing protein n=1 Tax=Rhodanobacter aciditrophus TaxID=1623218 RepID=UPI003CF49BA9